MYIDKWCNLSWNHKLEILIRYTGSYRPILTSPLTTGQSPWWPFHFCVIDILNKWHNTRGGYIDVECLDGWCIKWWLLMNGMIYDSLARKQQRSIGVFIAFSSEHHAIWYNPHFYSTTASKGIIILEDELVYKPVAKLLRHIHIEVHIIWQWSSNMAFDWLAVKFANAYI